MDAARVADHCPAAPAASPAQPGEQATWDSARDCCRRRRSLRQRGTRLAMVVIGAMGLAFAARHLSAQLDQTAAQLSRPAVVATGPAGTPAAAYVQPWETAPVEAASNAAQVSAAQRTGGMEPGEGRRLDAGAVALLQPGTR